MKERRVRRNSHYIGGKPRTEISGRLPDDEYEAMSASLKGKREMHGRTSEWKSGIYTRFRDRRERYIREETGRGR